MPLAADWGRYDDLAQAAKLSYKCLRVLKGRKAVGRGQEGNCLKQAFSWWV